MSIAHAALLAQLNARHIATPEALRGCSASDIDLLEARYRVTLPASYRWYLHTMGHASGRLFTHDHLAVTHRYVLDMTDDVRQESGGERGPVALPSDALIIAGRLGEQFEFIRCNDADDSPVWHTNTWNGSITRNHETVLAWLWSWADAAADAIASGYFGDSPNGTAA
jgi:hypothetical protein